MSAHAQVIIPGLSEFTFSDNDLFMIIPRTGSDIPGFPERPTLRPFPGGSTDGSFALVDDCSIPAWMDEKLLGLIAFVQGMGQTVEISSCKQKLVSDLIDALIQGN